MCDIEQNNEERIQNWVIEASYIFQNEDTIGVMFDFSNGYEKSVLYGGESGVETNKQSEWWLNWEAVGYVHYKIASLLSQC